MKGQQFCWNQIRRKGLQEEILVLSVLIILVGCHFSEWDGRTCNRSPGSGAALSFNLLHFIFAFSFPFLITMKTSRVFFILPIRYWFYTFQLYSRFLYRISSILFLIIKNNLRLEVSFKKWINKNKYMVLTISILNIITVIRIPF